MSQRDSHHEKGKWEVSSQLGKPFLNMIMEACEFFSRKRLGSQMFGFNGIDSMAILKQGSSHVQAGGICLPPHFFSSPWPFSFLLILRPNLLHSQLKSMRGLGEPRMCSHLRGITHNISVLKKGAGVGHLKHHGPELSSHGVSNLPISSELL